MEKNISKLRNLAIKMFTTITLVFLIIFDIRTSLEVSLIVTGLVILTIDKVLWKPILHFLSKYNILWHFIEDYETPILKEKYQCKIKSKYNGIEKDAILKIEQTYTSINVSLKTDEIESNAIISEIKKVNNQFVLYYIYVTNPKMAIRDKNPTQLGGCRIKLQTLKDNDANEKLDGIYWTTSQSTGDMELF